MIGVVSRDRRPRTMRPSVTTLRRGGNATAHEGHAFLLGSDSRTTWRCRSSFHCLADVIQSLRGLVGLGTAMCFWVTQLVLLVCPIATRLPFERHVALGLRGLVPSVAIVIRRIRSAEAEQCSSLVESQHLFARGGGY